MSMVIFGDNDDVSTYTNTFNKLCYGCYRRLKATGRFKRLYLRELLGR